MIAIYEIKGTGCSVLAVTHGGQGRALEQVNIFLIKKPAVPLQPRDGFSDSGVSPAAGQVFALASGLDPDETMDEFLTGLLRFNAEG